MPPSGAPLLLSVPGPHPPRHAFGRSTCARIDPSTRRHRFRTIHGLHGPRGPPREVIHRLVRGYRRSRAIGECRTRDVVSVREVDRSPCFPGPSWTVGPLTAAPAGIAHTPLQRAMNRTSEGPVDNPVHRVFAQVHALCDGAPKVFSMTFREVIHRRGLKSVDNAVDNLWTTPPSLWVTRGSPVDMRTRHRIIEPPTAVDNLGKTCG